MLKLDRVHQQGMTHGILKEAFQNLRRNFVFITV